MRRGLLVLLRVSFMPFVASADLFTNGGFENGNFDGWTQGAGSWTSTSYAWPINPDNYLPGGSAYNMSYWRGSIVTPGPDPIVGNLLNRVYNGNFAARVNDQFDNYDYSLGVIEQSVKAYTGSDLYFEWAAVLQESHGATNSDNFTLKVTDDTTHTEIYSRQYSSYSAAGLFSSIFSNDSNTYGTWYYTPWQVEHVSVTPGDDLTISLLAADCALGGHAGYVYLDGFDNVIIPPSNVPEPGAIFLLGTALAGVMLAALRRRRLT